MTAAVGLRVAPDPGPVVDRYTAAGIKEVLKTGACDALVSPEPIPYTEVLSSHVCSRLRDIVSWDRSHGVYEQPYTSAIFERNQKYWYRDNFRCNISYGLAVSAFLCLILYVAIVPIGAILEWPRH
jgi:hypothetical protein